MLLTEDELWGNLKINQKVSFTRKRIVALREGIDAVRKPRKLQNKSSVCGDFYKKENEATTSETISTNRVTTSDEQLVSQEQSNIMQEVECGNESDHANVDKQHENDDETRVIESETEEVDEAPEADDETTTFDLLMEENSHKVFVQNDIG